MMNKFPYQGEQLDPNNEGGNSKQGSDGRGQAIKGLNQHFHALAYSISQVMVSPIYDLVQLEPGVRHKITKPQIVKIRCADKSAPCVIKFFERSGYQMPSGPSNGCEQFEVFVS